MPPNPKPNTDGLKKARAAKAAKKAARLGRNRPKHPAEKLMTMDDVQKYMDDALKKIVLFADSEKEILDASGIVAGFLAKRRKLELDERRLNHLMEVEMNEGSNDKVNKLVEEAIKHADEVRITLNNKDNKKPTKD